MYLYTYLRLVEANIKGRGSYPSAYPFWDKWKENPVLTVPAQNTLFHTHIHTHLHICTVYIYTDSLSHTKVLSHTKSLSLNPAAIMLGNVDAHGYPLFSHDLETSPSWPGQRLTILPRIRNSLIKKLFALRPKYFLHCLKNPHI